MIGSPGIGLWKLPKTGKTCARVRYLYVLFIVIWLTVYIFVYTNKVKHFSFVHIVVLCDCDSQVTRSKHRSVIDKHCKTGSGDGIRCKMLKEVNILWVVTIKL